jgi:amino acid adenylation domain-containing protein
MTTPEMPAMDDGLDAALLAELLAEDGFDLPSEALAILPRAVSSRVLATPAQQRLWTVERIDGVTGEFNLGLDIRFNTPLDAPLDVAALERALLALLQRHEGLRVRFSDEDDGAIGQHFTQVDSISLPLHAVAVELWPSYLRDAVAQPFDLAADLLLRAQVLHDDKSGESALLLTFHHNIIDLWSGQLLLRELVTLYARERGETVTLPEPVQFGDYAVWLREPQQVAARTLLHAYWKQRLAQLPVALEIPFSGPRGQAGSALCERIPVSLPAPLTAAVKRFADATRTTPFVVVLAAFHTVLARYSGMDDIAIGVPVVNRPQQQTQAIVGFLAENMVSRNVSAAGQSFQALTGQVRDHMLEDMRHQELPFDEVVNLVNPERRKGLAPLFQAMLVFQTMPPLEAQTGSVRAHAMSVPLPAARADIVLELEAGAEQIAGGLEYRRHFIDPQIAAGIAAALEVVLEAALADPQLTLSKLPLQRGPAARDMLARLNPPLPLLMPSLPSLPSAPRTLSAWFAEQAAKTPDAVALIENDRQATYAELDRRSAALAAHLAQLGVAAETPVAICLPRSIDLAVAILATIRAGGAFVPMDPDFPAERLRYMLSASSAPVLVTTGAAQWLPAGSDVRLVDPAQALPHVSAPAPQDRNHADSLLYILFTSGSTGRPKAVMGLHRGAVNRIAWMLERYPFEPTDRYCQKTTPTFVDFVWELFGPLLGGVPSVILSPAQVRDPRALAAALQSHRITRLTLVPSLLKSLLDHVADVGSVLAGLRHCICSSETFPGDLARRFLSLLPACRLLNLYGSSEASADSTCHEVDVADGAQVHIGQPIPGNLLAILDPAGNVLPVGAVGEIVIGGVGLARGYLNHNDGEARFIDLPADVAGGRAFRSGDLGRWRPDGNIDYLGRRDRQVKIRGVRIDPEEVRAALRRCPGVTDAVVVAREIDGDLILMAYVVAEKTVETGMRRRLQDILPTALQPSRYVFMPALPLNSNGKIDFLNLPAPGPESPPPTQEQQQGQQGQQQRQESAMTLEESLLADIWRQIIGHRPRQSNANFFQSGGHSLSAVRLVAAIEKSLGVRLPVTAVFDAPTLHAMALEVRREQPGADVPALVAGGPHRRARASFNQERLWLIEQSGQQRGAYNQAVAYRLRGGRLDVARLELAFRRVMQRHEALRTRLVLADGELWQEVDASPEFTLDRIDADIEGTERQLQEFTERYFSLADDLPLRAQLIRRGDDDHLLVIVAHHTAFDGGSGRVIVEQLGQAYGDVTDVADAAPPALQQIDFSTWQRDCDEQGAFEVQGHYWRDQLAGAPAVLGLALSRMPEQRDFRLGRVPLVLGQERSERLQQAANDAGVSTFALLLGVWGLTLARFGDEREVVVGIPVAARSRAGLDGVVGFLANTLPMRLDCHAANLAEFGRRVQQRVAEGLQHQDISFSRIVEAAGVERVPQRPPLLQAMFVLADVRQWQLQLDDIDAVAQPISAPLARTDLSMALQQDAQGIAGELEYAADIIAPALAERIAAGFVHLLDALLAQPDAAPLSHSLLDAQARASLMQFGQAHSVLPPASRPLRLHALLHASAQRNGDAAALATPEGTLSYRQLDALSGVFAQSLRAAGLNPGARIALIGERSIGLIAALLGISKAGCVFVPIDPTYPAARIEQMLLDAEVALVVGDCPDGWNATQWMRLPSLQDLPSGWAPDEVGQPDITDTDFAATACIIFTSGSTGRPKGVALAHHALCRLALSAVEEFSLKQDSRILQLAAFGFDVAVSDIVFALAAGACLCLAPRERLLPGSPLMQTLDAMHITHLQIPASLLAAMPAAALPRLRTLIVGGELCPASVAAQWRQDRDLFIAYGPTETTVTVTAGRYIDADAPLQIGRPLGDARIYVLDGQGAPAPVGVVGELCIGGSGVSIGYLNNPVLTQERFVPDPFPDDPQARMYRSGDRARWREDGTLDFLGRSDREFKLRGFRIAPAEIEAALSQQTGVTQALAMLRPDGAGQTRLVAYVVGKDVNAATLRAALRRALPSFMVPDFISVLERMPLTGNGKIDVNALPQPVFGREGATTVSGPNADDYLARVAALWRQVLNLGDVDPDANFFDVGGHSLLLVRLYDMSIAEFGAVLSISDLFRFPTIRSLASHLSSHGESSRPVRPAQALLSAQAEIAVIGMACRFPGAPDVDAFWQLLVEGREGISRHDAAALAAAGRAGNELDHANFVAAGGVIDHADCFDAEFFGLGPRDAVTLDPQHRVALECAWHAMEHAGYAAAESRGDANNLGEVGIFVGVGVNTYLQGQLFAAGPMPEGADSYHAMSGNDKDFGATRIAYHLDLKGPALAVQTACSSSLTALDMACRSLRSGGAGMALAGGVAIRFPQGSGYFHEPGMILSPDGHCKPFSADARGTVPSGGVGMVLLKPLAQAQADGDNVLAVIRGSAVNNDGGRKVGYAAPGVDGQAAVIASALQQAGLEPADIDYVEAHGTGTELGDPVEVAALTRVFGGRQRPLALGSVKSNIGHADAAAGVAGLIKTILALQHGILPPSLHFSEVNPHVDFTTASISVVGSAQAWPDHGDGRPRRAGVSAFGIGGTNVHVVLEQAPARVQPVSATAAQLVLPLSARTPESLHSSILALADALQRAPQLPLRDVAFTLQQGRAAFGCRHAVVASTVAEAVAALRLATEPAAVTGTAKLAFLFPGQGSQYPRMAQALYEGDADYRFWFDRCAVALLPHLQQDLRTVLYGAVAEDPAAVAALRQTALAQPALFAVMYSLARSLEARGVEAVAMLGHSLGEYVAACLAGVFELDDALALVAARGRLMQALPGGAMLAVQVDEAQARELLQNKGEAISLAAINGPGQCVLAGATAAIDALQAHLKEIEVPAVRLETSHAFHSSSMEAVLPAFVAQFDRITLKPPQRRFISNVTGAWISAADAVDPAYWARHLRQAVRFGDGLGTLQREGIDLLLEVGPGSALQKLARTGGWSAPQLISLGLNRQVPQQAPALAAIVAQLWTRGATIDWRKASRSEDVPAPARVALPGYVFERKRHWPSAPVPVLAQENSPARRAEIADWFYLPGWQRAPQLSPVSARATSNEVWLLLGAETDAGRTLAAGLRALGRQVVEVRAGAAFEMFSTQGYAIDPTSEGDYRRLLDSVAATRVVHLWTSVRQTFATALDHGFASVMLLAQAFGARLQARPLQLDIVTCGAADVTGDEPLTAALGTLLGIAKIIPVEYRSLACRVIDIEANGSAALLLTELLHGQANAQDQAQIALRRRHRWIPQVQPVRLAAPVTGGDRLRERGCYLITGAFGGMGASIAGDLAVRCRARLVLLGRHVDQSLVDELEHAGAEVLASTCDVADSIALTQVIAAAHTRFGVIHGAFHCAGVADLGGIIQNRNIASMHQVMAAKVHGTVWLDRLLEEDAPDFMVLFSTLGSLLPQAKFGQAAYAAGNEFLDLFAQERTARGSFTTVLNWDDWSEAGMTVAAYRRRGQAAPDSNEAMRSEEGVEVLRRVLSTPHVRVAVSIRDLPGLMAQADTLLDKLSTPLPMEEVGTSSSPSSAVAGMTDTEAKLAATWRSILGVADIARDANFFELGGHSLIGMRLLAFVRESFGVDLNIAAIFEHATLAALAGHIDACRSTDDGMEEFTI